MRAFSNVRTYFGQAAGCYMQVEATNANKADKAFQTGKWNTVCQHQSLLWITSEVTGRHWYIKLKFIKWIRYTWLKKRDMMEKKVVSLFLPQDTFSLRGAQDIAWGCEPLFLVMSSTADARVEFNITAVAITAGWQQPLCPSFKHLVRARPAEVMPGSLGQKSTLTTGLRNQT